MTTMLPYFLITILFFRAIGLEGSADGIRYFLTPNWHRMMRPHVREQVDTAANIATSNVIIK